MRLFLAWRGLDEWRAEACTIDRGDHGLRAAGVQISPAYRLEYRLETDPELLTRSLALTVQSEAGEPVDHVMAWVDVPSLDVLRSEQRYELLDGPRVRFVGLEDGFTADLELDDHGFVTRYPGLAERA